MHRLGGSRGSHPGEESKPARISFNESTPDFLHRLVFSLELGLWLWRWSGKDKGVLFFLVGVPTSLPPALVGLLPPTLAAPSELRVLESLSGASGGWFSGSVPLLSTNSSIPSSTP